MGAGLRSVLPKIRSITIEVKYHFLGYFVTFFGCFQVYSALLGSPVTDCVAGSSLNSPKIQKIRNFGKPKNSLFHHFRASN